MPTLRKRPVFINLFQIQLPMPGIMSIVHRVAGVFIFLSLPVWLYLLQISLQDQAGFDQTLAIMQHWFFKVFLFASLWALVHHLLAGIRYLLIDIDIGIEKPLYQITAKIVLFISPVLALLLLGGLL